MPEPLDYEPPNPPPDWTQVGADVILILFVVMWSALVLLFLLAILLR